MIAFIVLFAPVPLDLPAKAKAEALKRVVALSKQMGTGISDAAAGEAADAIKAVGNPIAVQRALAERYPKAEAREKEAILYVLKRIGVEGAGDALGPIASDFAVARKTHPNGL
jgi:hypothetical protein